MDIAMFALMAGVFAFMVASSYVIFKDASED